MVSSSARLRGAALVLLAACLWATLGLFYRALVEQFGLTRPAVVAYRAAVTAVLLFGGLGLSRPRLLRVRWRDVPFFMLFGGIGVAAFFLCYIEATTAGPLAVAAVLLYTAPIWIAVWSAVQGERLDGRKLLALGFAFAGCALVANIWDPAVREVNGRALLFGLLSGLGYAAYSLYSASGVRRGYHVWTVVAYSSGIGALVMLATQPPADWLEPLRVSAAWPYLLGVALGPSLLAQGAFTLGLRYVRTTTASILATAEPVVAALLGWLVVVPAEPLNAGQLAGGAFVLAAVLLLMRGDRGLSAKQQS